MSLEAYIRYVVILSPRFPLMHLYCPLIYENHFCFLYFIIYLASQVNPIAVNSKYCNVFTENKRTVAIISTLEFGKVRTHKALYF